MKEGEEPEEDVGDSAVIEVQEESEEETEVVNIPVKKKQNRKRIATTDNGRNAPPTKRGRKPKNLEEMQIAGEKRIRVITKEVEKFINAGPMRNQEHVLAFNR